VSELTPKFELLIEKTFGADIGVLWGNYRSVLERFINIPVTEKNKSYSPLNRNFRGQE
jgi:hypothetical protein